MSSFGNPKFLGDFLIIMNSITLVLFMYKKKFYLAILWFLILICALIMQYVKNGTWLGFASELEIFLLDYYRTNSVFLQSVTWLST
jgi:hypothetical protein